MYGVSRPSTIMKEVRDGSWERVRVATPEQEQKLKKIEEREGKSVIAILVRKVNVRLSKLRVVQGSLVRVRVLTFVAIEERVVIFEYNGVLLNTRFPVKAHDETLI